MRCVTRKQKGFTLIELAISLVIIGTLSAAAIAAYTTYYQKKQITDTKFNVSDVNDKVASFLSKNKFLPCPAAPNDATATATDCSVAAPACPPAGGNVCDVPGAGGRFLRIGVLPVTVPMAWPVGPATPRQQLVNGDESFDGFHNKLSYAVMTDLAQNPAAYALAPVTGQIAINDPNGAVITNTARYIVISHGPDGAGAYSASGVRRPCNAASADGANCDDADMAFVSVTANQSRSRAGGANQNDDFVEGDILNVSQPCPVGTEMRGVDFTNKQPLCVARDMSCPAKNQAFVGITHQNPADTTSPIRAVCADIHAACPTGQVMVSFTAELQNAPKDATGNNVVSTTTGASPAKTCVTPQTTEPGDCPTGEVVVGLNAPDANGVSSKHCVAPLDTSKTCTGNDIVVGSVFNAATQKYEAQCATRTASSCSGTNVAVGINADGTTNCQPAPSCATGTMFNKVTNGVPACGNETASVTNNTYNSYNTSGIADRDCAAEGKVSGGVVGGAVTCTAQTPANTLFVDSQGFGGSSDESHQIDLYNNAMYNAAAAWPDLGGNATSINEWRNKCAMSSNGTLDYNNYPPENKTIEQYQDQITQCLQMLCAWNNGNAPHFRPKIVQGTGHCPVGGCANSASVYFGFNYSCFHDTSLAY